MLITGLKVYSINFNYIRDAVRFYEAGLYQYIELYSVPHSYEKYIKIWKNLGIPFVIHAPHYSDGINLAKKENRINNLALAEEAIKFADILKSKIIIFHPGVDGDIEETARQINEINDRRIVIENKPYYSNNKYSLCNGYSPEEIRFIMEKAGIGFCLDFAHCICAANAVHIDPMNYAAEFLKLKPLIFHLTDGDYTGIYDTHDHFGMGSYPLKQLTGIIPQGSMLTIETIKNSQNNLNDFAEDMRYLGNLF